MIKKILKIAAVLVLLIIGLLIATPYFFKDQIKAKIEQAINENVDAKVSFAEADLSLFKNFPNANVNLSRFVIINKAPFAGDTLVSLGELNLKMSIKELFKSKTESINIQGIESKNGLINIIFDKNGKGNFDIAIKKEDANNQKSDPLVLKIQKYSVENFRFRYFDQRSKIEMTMDSLNHQGTGDFAAAKLDLDTHSFAKVSLKMDKISYMKNLRVNLEAVLGIDLEKNQYTFKENVAKINELPLKFNGFIALTDQGQIYDLSFQTPTSSFKNFLGLLPAAYSTSLDGVKTNGDFTVNGFAKGLFSDKTVPKFNIQIASNNASFQYPNLPKSVRNIVIDTKIINQTGILNDTYVNLDKLSFQIDQDVFLAKANIKNVTQNPVVAAELKGTINLAKLSQAYPIQLKKPLQGILKANVTTKFDMESVSSSKYQNIDNQGNMSLSNFNFTDENGKAMTISTAIVQFNPSRVNLEKLEATTGKSDLKVSGVLNNFYGFLFKNQEIEGNFTMSSNQIAVSDFLTTAAPSKSNQKATAMKIPSFLNCTITANANTVLYDNLVLKAVAGKLLIKDQKVTLENVKTNIFGGSIGFNGTVSTKEKTPAFDMILGLNQVDIAQTFSQLEMLKKVAPMAGYISGKLNSTLKLNGNLDANSLAPDLKSLSGDMLGQLLSTKITTANSSTLTALTTNLKFLDLSKLNLNDVKAILTFENGKVNLKPIDLKYQDIAATISGTHGFDQNMNYALKLSVPAKYLGNEANALLAKLSAAETTKLDNIPINALISGSFGSPKITTDFKSAISNLTSQLIQQQKEKLVKQGTNALGDLINKTKKTGDTTKTVIPTTKEAVKEAVKEEVKNKAKDLLNGWLKK